MSTQEQSVLADLYRATRPGLDPALHPFIGPPFPVDADYWPTRRKPISPNTPLLDQAFWDTAEQRATEHRARVLSARMEVRSYFATVGQSTREDYNRAFADLYGMESVGHSGWTNSYTSFEALAYLLNRLDNLTAGQKVTQRVAKTLAFEPHTFEVYSAKPAVRVQRCLAWLDWSCAIFGLRFSTLPAWRTRRDASGQLVADVLTTVTKPRPSEVTYVTVEVDADPVWTNPCLLEDGMTLLEDSMQRNFRSTGVEGLSIVIDKHERMHLVYWITARFPHPHRDRQGRVSTYQAQRPSKKPLAVHSFPIGTDPDDAIAEMRAVSTGMTRTARDGQAAEVPGWIAAELDAERIGASSAPDITGSHEWLAAISDQRATGTTYRPHGQESDD